MVEKKAENTSDSSSFLGWTFLVLLGLIWGSSFILIKKGLIAFSAPQVASLRIALSAIAFLPFFIARLKKIDWSKWKSLMIVGFAGSLIPAFLFAAAQTELSSSITGVLSSLTPLFTLVFGIFLFKTPKVWTKILGVIIGLLGAILLVLLNQNSGEVGNVFFGILVALATASYGYANNVIKTYLQEMSALTISAVSFIMIGVPSLIYLFTTDFISVLQQEEHGWASFGYISILALGGTVIASLLFFKLVQLTNAVFASMASYLIPIVALLWGAFDGENINLFHFVGMTLILGGVYISRK